MNRSPRRAAAFLVLFAVSLAPLRADRDVWTRVSRVVAVGDVHGDYGQLVAVLRSAGVIDAAGNWSGGKTHLVQTGDVLDRGPDSPKAMDLLIKLERQARQAGGYVHCLIGNHEAMNLYGDLRYVPRAEYVAFAGEDPPNADPAQPPGWEARRLAFSPEGKYGKWIRGHNAVIRINRTLFLHGGISPKYAALSIRQINDEVRAELQDFTKLEGGIVTDPEGPLWYRGLADGDEQALAPHLAAVLESNQVERIVIGHTFTDGAVMPRFSGKVLVIDIGLSHVYDQAGRLACLLIERGKPVVLHRGKRLPLPADSGAGLLAYLKGAAALDPAPSPLQARIAQLQAMLSAAPAP